MLYYIYYIYRERQRKKESKLAVNFICMILLTCLLKIYASPLRKTSYSQYTRLVGMGFLMKHCNLGNKPESESLSFILLLSY